jgi:hypothetical protein
VKRVLSGSPSMRAIVARVVVAVAVLSLGCFNGDAHSREPFRLKPTVSVLELLVRPAVYDGQEVFVRGYYVDKDRTLYPSRDFAEGFISSSIRVLVSENPKIGYIGTKASERVDSPQIADCSNRYVTIWGTAELSPPTNALEPGKYELSNIKVVLVH